MAATTSHRNAATLATAKREVETRPKETPPRIAEDLVDPPAYPGGPAPLGEELADIGNGDAAKRHTGQ